MDLDADNCSLDFPEIELGISARRIWEHIRHRQLNPFVAITDRNAANPEMFVDVVDCSGSYEIYLGFTVAELRNRSAITLPAFKSDALFARLEDPALQRWFTQVRQLLRSSLNQKAVRNAPVRFLPLDTIARLGIKGLRATLADWLELHKIERAFSQHWRNRIQNLTQKGLKQEEIEATGIQAGLADAPEKISLSGEQVESVLDYSRHRLSVIPVIDLVSNHLMWTPAPKTDAIKRIKPKIRNKPPTTPQWWDSVMGYWIDMVEWDDLLGHSSGWMAFNHRGISLASRDRPTGLFESPEQAKSCANAHAARILPKLTAKGNWAQYRLTGGKNYREWLVTLPNYPASYFSDHFLHRNIFLHVRCDIREGANQEKVLFLQEVQSDWAQQARRELQTFAEAPQQLPPPPWRHDWPALALKLMILHACESNCDALAWTTGLEQVNRYGGLGEQGLRELYDRTLPKEANRLLKSFGIFCDELEIFLPANFYLEPTDAGYDVLNSDRIRIGTADTWQQAQELIPCGAHEQLGRMHGIRWDKAAQTTILERGFPAWGNGIS